MDTSLTSNKVPKTICCYICEKEFRLKTITSHLEKCRERFALEQAKLP